MCCDPCCSCAFRSRFRSTIWPCWLWTLMGAGGQRRTVPKRVWPSTSWTSWRGKRRCWRITFPWRLTRSVHIEWSCVRNLLRKRQKPTFQRKFFESVLLWCHKGHCYLSQGRTNTLLLVSIWLCEMSLSLFLSKHAKGAKKLFKLGVLTDGCQHRAN